MNKIYLALASASCIAACGPARPPEDLAASLPVTVGTIYDRGGGPRLPVTVENRTAEALPYVQVTCAFYGPSGAILESAFENWTNVPAGVRVSGEVLPETSDPARVECIASL